MNQEQTQEIVLYPEEFLRRKAAKVKEINDCWKDIYMAVEGFNNFRRNVLLVNKKRYMDRLFV